MDNLLVSLFQVIQYVMSEFGLTLVTLFDNITNIFFTVSSVDDSVMITPIGILTLCTFGIGLIWTGIRWLSRLIKMRG